MAACHLTLILIVSTMATSIMGQNPQQDNQQQSCTCPCITGLTGPTGPMGPPGVGLPGVQGPQGKTF